MDRVEIELARVAKELAAASQFLLLRTTAEIAELEEQLRQLRAQRDGQVNAHARVESYHPRAAEAEYRCPNCWIRDGQSTALTPITFENPHDDILRCSACGRDFGLSLRA